MKKPNGKSYNALPFKTVLEAIAVLMEGFGMFAGVVVDLLCNHEDYRRRVIEFILLGAFIPSDEYERAKSIMGFDFSGVDTAFGLGLTFRQIDQRSIRRIPYKEETLKQCAGTHFLVLVPSAVYTMFRDSQDDVIQNPEEHLRESFQSGWHWILYRIDAVPAPSQNEELVPLFDALYVREVNRVTNHHPLKVGNTFKSNGDQVVLVPLEGGQYSTRHPGNDELRSCVMVKPDKV